MTVDSCIHPLHSSPYQPILSFGGGSGSSERQGNRSPLNRGGSPLCQPHIFDARVMSNLPDLAGFAQIGGNTPLAGQRCWTDGRGAARALPNAPWVLGRKSVKLYMDFADRSLFPGRISSWTSRRRDLFSFAILLYIWTKW